MKARKRFFVAATLAVATGVLVVACDATDEEAGPPKKPGTGTDATVSSDAMAAGDGPTSVPGLCDRVGGFAKVATISNQIYAKAAADCRIGVYFSRLSTDAQAHVQQCMQRHLGEVFGCGIVYAGSKDNKGNDCRGLGRAHENLVGPDGQSQLNQNDYQAYVAATQSVLTENNLSSDDITSVMSVFFNVKNTVAPDNVQGNYNSYCTCPQNQFNGASCVPEGGYVIPVKDGGNDTGNTDTGTPDTGTIVDADDAG